MAKKITILSIFSLLLFALTSCEEKFSSDPSMTLQFSADTVKFDTIFTDVSSLTMEVHVYNPQKEGIHISSIALRGGASSHFRFNLDGQACAPGASLQDIEILGKDSLFLLVEVTLPSQNQTTPFRLEDEIIFTYNSKTQSLPLEAYGQQAHIMRDLHITKDSTLSNEYPFLVYGALTVDSGAKLTINPGCTLYMHDKSQMVVYGQLNVAGTAEEPVLMRGDRLDNLFAKVPYDMSSGQWYGLFLVSQQKHTLDHLELRSSVYGVYAQSTGNNPLQQLQLDGCRLHNSSVYGLVCIDTRLTAVNTEVSNCGNYCVYLLGGKHEFYHCTIANYYNHADHGIQGSSREAVPAVCVNDIPKYAQMSTYFYNSIITGTRDEEWALLTYFPKQYPAAIQHCYLRTDSAALADQSQYSDIHFYHKGDELFQCSYYTYTDCLPYNFQLDSLSPARNIADSAIAARYRYDRLGHDRFADGRPDLGAYEY